MPQSIVKTVPIFLAHFDKSSGCHYGAVTQHQLGERCLLVFTRDIAGELPLRVFVVGWLLGQPRERPGLAPMAEVSLVSMPDHPKVMEFVRRLYPKHGIQFWEDR